MTEQKLIKVELRNGEGLNAFPRFRALREQGWQIDAAGTIQRFDGTPIMLVRLTRPELAPVASTTGAPVPDWAAHRAVAS